MIAMNARAELQGVAFDAIARDFLAGTQGPAGAGARGFWAKLFAPDLGRLAWQHLGLVAASVAARRAGGDSAGGGQLRAAAAARLAAGRHRACCRPCLRWHCWRS